MILIVFSTKSAKFRKHQRAFNMPVGSQVLTLYRKSLFFMQNPVCGTRQAKSSCQAAPI